MADDDTSPQRVSAMRGKAELGEYAKGSKSARDAMFIVTASGRYILRRKNGPVFGDDELAQYAGHEIECDGFVVGTTLLAEEIRIVK